MPRIKAKSDGRGPIAGGSNETDGAPVIVGDSSSGSVDSVSSRDVEDCVRLLDEVWPQTDLAEVCPRKFGRFSILRELGRGGFGVVFLAEDPFLGRRVALKVPRIDVLSDPQSWRRFLREARTASRLDHPNLVPLLEAGAVGPVGYIASAFVEGPTLDQCLRRARSGAPARFSARLIATLASALEHMHDRGILHRDVKPANILMQAPTRDGEVAERSPWDGPGAESWVPRVCDFGLARLREIDGDETRSRTAAGSPPYMSPEQAEARHSDIGPATDVYGLGATLYQLLTGRPPFAGASELETLRKVVTDEPVRPRQLRPELPRDLETICLKCLAKRPEQRYRKARALADDLDRFLEGRPIVARRVPAWERGWKWARRHPALAALGIATTLSAFAVFGGLLWHDSVLRRVNEQLRQEATRAEENARDALDQRKLLEKHERLLRRQLAAHQVFAAQQAVFAGNFELAHRMLESADSGLESHQARGFAWSYLWHSVRDRLELLRGHEGSVTWVVADRSGHRLATADDKGQVRLWDTRRGQSVGLLPAHDAPIHRLAMSADGRTVASCPHRAREILVWDVASASLIGRLSAGFNSAVAELLFVADGRRLLAIRDQGDSRAVPITAWDIAPGAATPGPLPIEEIARIPEAMRDERLTVIADLLDVEPGARLSASALAELRASLCRRPPRGLARTRDGVMTVMGTGDGRVNVYRTSAGLLLATCRFGFDGTAIVLRDPTRRVKPLEPQDRERPEMMAKRLFPDPLEPRHGPGIVLRLDWWDQFAFSPGGRQLAVGEGEDRLCTIDLATGRELKRYDLGRIQGRSAMSFRADGATLVLGGKDHVVRLWHLDGNPDPVALRGHAPKEAWAVAFAPDGLTLASSGDDGRIRIWDSATGKERAVLRGHTALVSSIAYAPDGRTLVSGSFDRNNHVILWNLAANRPKFNLRGHAAKVRAVDYNPDGRTVASADEDGTIIVWGTDDGRSLAKLRQGEKVNCIAFSPDGRTLAAGDAQGRITLFNLTTLNSWTIEGIAGVESLIFSPDGSRIYSGHHGGLIMEWEAATGNRVEELPGHYVNVFGLAVSPDGATLASAGYDGAVFLWDTATGQQLLRLGDRKAQVNAVAFSPEGNALAAADHSGAITIWHAGPRSPATAANTHAQSPSVEPLAAAKGKR
jgi:WD40 repeat protein/tRNA A-37 threonylcarbamoyl transferase component Bud32